MVVILNKIKVSAKLIFLVLLLLGIIIAIGVYSIHELKIMNRNTETLYGDRVIPLQQLTTVRFAYANGMLSVAQRVNNNQHDFSLALHQLLEYEKSIKVNWQAYKKTYLTKEEADLLRRTEELMVQGDKTIEKIKYALGKNDAVAINTIVNEELDNEVFPVIDKLNQLVQLQINVSGTLYKKNLEVYSSTAVKFYITIAASLLFAITLSFFIVSDIKRLIKNLETSNQEIRMSEEKWRAFIKYAGDAILILDDKLQITDLNDSACKLFGYDAGELLQMKISSLMPPNEQESLSQKVEMIRKYNDSLQEIKFVRKDGSHVDAELNVRELTGKRYVSIIRDITERKKERQLLEAILDHTPENIVLMDINYKVICYNEIIKRTLLGFFGRELQIGDDYREFVVDHAMPLFLESFDKAIAGETTDIELETIAEHLSICFEYKVNPIYAYDGKLLGVSLSAKDITKRKLAEKELIESEEKFRTLVEQNLVGVFILQDEKFMYVNPGFERITGYSGDALMQGMSFKDLIHEDDIERISENYTKRMRGEKLTNNYTLKAIRADGDLRHIEIIISTIIYKGEPAIIGTTIDITERIEEEARLGKAVTNAQEKERTEIGMELHDNVTQLLAGSVLYLDIVNKNLADNTREAELIGNVKGYIGEAIDELRKLSHRLAPAIESGTSLSDKINELVKNMNVNENLSVTISIDDSNEKVNKDIQLACYRIVQEQFNNILKYSHASSVRIKIEQNGHGLVLSITDDGKGFDTSTKNDGIGLENIKRRSQALGGQVKIISSPGNGCNIFIQIPIK